MSMSVRYLCCWETRYHCTQTKTIWDEAELYIHYLRILQKNYSTLYKYFWRVTDASGKIEINESGTFPFKKEDLDPEVRRTCYYPDPNSGCAMYSSMFLRLVLLSYWWNTILMKNAYVLSQTELGSFSVQKYSIVNMLSCFIFHQKADPYCTLYKF